MGAEEPRRIGRYDLLLPIARGGMGTVYLARAAGAAGFEREVALKLTHQHLRESETFATEVLAEAQIASRVRHTNVVPVLDVGEDEHGIFLVMEYVEGDSLAGLLKKGREAGTPLPVRVGLRVLVDALAGLQAAHELTDEDGNPQHVVHRDFSPQNILVGLDGMSRLTDFGIARAASRASHTASGVVKGKAAYVSPEQAQDLPLDRRSDVWAAGVVAWELLAGRRMYPSDNEAAVLLKIVREAAPRVSSVVADVPPPLDEAIARALSTDRESRTATAHGFARDLALAARPFGLLAETEEVVEWVTRLAGPALEQRRQASVGLRRARPSDPSLAADAPPEPPSVPQSQIATVPPFRPRAVDEMATDTSAVAEPFGAPRKHNPILLAAAGGAGLSLLVAVIAVGLLSSRARRAEDDGARAVAAAAELPPDLPPPTEPQPPAPPTPTAPAPQATAIEIVEAHRTKVEVEATAPMRVLFVDGRTVRLDTPASSATVPLEGTEPDRALKISAMTADGRTANGELSASATKVRLVFPRRGAAGPKPRLAKNPFEK